MPTIPFSELQTASDVAKQLGLHLEALQRYVTGDQSALYRQMEIPKKGRRRRGKFRIVFRCLDIGLATAHKTLAAALNSQILFPEYVQGFVLKRSIVSNARIHLAQERVLHADIESFFDSIDLSRVRSAFQALGCNVEVADTLGRLCTRNGALPQGGHASPALSNLVCRGLDIDLSTLASAHRCRYSRYADDITISGDSTPPESVVDAALKQHGFKLRDGRCVLQRKGHAQFVTGLSVADASRPRIPRNVKRRLRQQLYYAERFGLADHLRRIHWSGKPAGEYFGGWLCFIHSIEPEAAQRLRVRWERVRSSEMGRSQFDESAES